MVFTDYKEAFDSVKRNLEKFGKNRNCSTLFEKSEKYIHYTENDVLTFYTLSHSREGLNV
jgi:hypothetical protein